MPPNRPRQVVILAGGRGRRLRALTDRIPKPMVPFHGQPFLTYLLQMLQRQGFERVLLLLGYRGRAIEEEYGSGKKLGLSIEYSLTSPENETGRRLALVYDRLDPCFLLVYCDNYWPMQFQTMWERYLAAGLPAMTTVYSNRDGYSKSNVRLDERGYVVAYDRYRKQPGLSGVEIGFAILNKDILRLLPRGNPVFQIEVYSRLIRKRQLLAYSTDHRYYSVGSLDRLTLTDAFLAPQRAVILDRDGVLNRKLRRAYYVTHWKQFKWIAKSREALRLLKQAGYRLILVTNQAGVARGFMTQLDLDMIHQQMQNDLRRFDAAIDKIYVCAHGWNDNCRCRKPNPELLFQAQKDFHLDLTRTPFVGDNERDMEAGRRAGCPAFWVSPRHNLYEWTRKFLIATMRTRDRLLGSAPIGWPKPPSSHER